MNKTIIYIALIYIAIVLLIGKTALAAQSQQQPASQSATTQQPKADTKPFEFQPIILEGRDELSIQSGIKLFPDSPNPLSARQLDSLNPLEKQQSLLLPSKPLPRKYFSFHPANAYLKGEFGQFITASLDAGYSFELEGYRMAIGAGFETSQGQSDNTEYWKAFVTAASDYIAPEKFFIFGGSRTHLNLDINLRNYNIIDSSNATQRQSSLIGFKVKSDGRFEGVNFSTGAHIDFFGFDAPQSHSMQGFGGFIKAAGNYEKYVIGAIVKADFQSSNKAQLASLFSGRALAEYKQDKLDAQGFAGFAVATNSEGAGRGSLELGAIANYLLNQSFTLNAGLSNVVAGGNYLSQTMQNPYLQKPYVDYGNNLSLTIGAQYHPTAEFRTMFYIGYTFSDRAPFFESDSSGNGLFDGCYAKTNKIEVKAEAKYDLTNNDILTGSATLLSHTFADGGNTVPYSPLFQIAIDYDKKFSEAFGMQIGVNFIGERYDDSKNIKKIDAQPIINLKGIYNINKDLSFFARIENLLNSDVMVWYGYKERGLFLSAGAFIRL